MKVRWSETALAELEDIFTIDENAAEVVILHVRHTSRQP
jgi:plasmid stabilization system protein ParE